MGIATKRRKFSLQIVQRSAGEANHLSAASDKVDTIQAHRVDDHDTPIICAMRRRSSGQSGIGRLHDHDMPGPNTREQHMPLFHQ